MPKANRTSSTTGEAGRIPLAETAGALPHFARNLNEAVTGAVYTLHLLRFSMERHAETMDEGGTVSNYVSVIRLVTAGLEGPHEDFGRTLRAHESVMGAAQ